MPNPTSPEKVVASLRPSSEVDPVSCSLIPFFLSYARVISGVHTNIHLRTVFTSLRDVSKPTTCSLRAVSREIETARPPFERGCGRWRRTVNYKDVRKVACISGERALVDLEVSARFS